VERAIVIFQNSNNEVIGTWRGGDTLPVNTDPLLTYFEVTIAQIEEVTSKGLTFGNQKRWKVLAGVLTEQADGRARVRFTPTAISVQVGSVPPTVQVTRIDNNGVTIPTTGTVKTTMLGFPVSIALVNGIGTLTVPTGKVRDVVIGDGPNYRVEAPLSIEVFALNSLEL